MEVHVATPLGEVGHLIMSLLQFFTKCASERIFKIGQYLAKIWTKVSWHLFMAHGV